MNEERTTGDKILRGCLIVALGLFVFAGLVLGTCFLIY